MKIVQIAQCPSPTVKPAATVKEAVRVMAESNSGAATVLDGRKLVGIISERDVMLRVVGAGKDPGTTKVRQVMTKTVKTLGPDCRTEDALSVMIANHIRHVVLVDTAGTVVGIASARHVFQAHVEWLDDQVRSLEAFAGNDRRGG